MLNSIVKQFIELVLFLGMVFGLLYFLLIAGDASSALVPSAKFYFWLVGPLAALGLIFGTISILYRTIVKRHV